MPVVGSSHSVASKATGDTARWLHHSAQAGWGLRLPRPLARKWAGRHEPARMRFLVQHQAAVNDAADVDYASDLSRGGLFINTSKPMAKQATLHVQFAPRKDARLISAFCQVTDVTPEGVTARFLDLDEESKELISAALA